MTAHAPTRGARPAGEDIHGHRLPRHEPRARGLVNMELHHGDGSLGTVLGVQSGLAMKSIDLLGSDEGEAALAARDGAS